MRPRRQKNALWEAVRIRMLQDQQRMGQNSRDSQAALLNAQAEAIRLQTERLKQQAAVPEPPVPVPSLPRQPEQKVRGAWDEDACFPRLDPLGPIVVVGHSGDSRNGADLADMVLGSVLRGNG